MKKHSTQRQGHIFGYLVLKKKKKCCSRTGGGCVFCQSLLSDRAHLFSLLWFDSQLARAIYFSYTFGSQSGNDDLDNFEQFSCLSF